MNMRGVEMSTIRTWLDENYITYKYEAESNVVSELYVSRFDLHIRFAYSKYFMNDKIYRNQSLVIQNLKQL